MKDTDRRGSQEREGSNLHVEGNQESEGRQYSMCQGNFIRNPRMLFKTVNRKSKGRVQKFSSTVVMWKLYYIPPR